MDLQSAVLQRLDEDPKARKAGWDVLVLAALDGAESLDAQLQPDAPSKTAPTRAAVGPAKEPVGAYLRSIRVEGFRGIGPTATIELTPGPGLTLVVGRNGCGKSSFAEGLELLLTGDTFRWGHGRSTVWREGWRNLHHTPTAVLAEFLIEGERGPATAATRWADGVELAGRTASFQIHGKPKSSLEDLGWTGALATYRPFLSYNELGSMLDEQPSKLYDALSSILGLEELVAVREALAEARKTREKTLKQAREALEPILAQIREFGDDGRAVALGNALGQDDSGLDAATAIIDEAARGSGSDQDIRLLRQLAALTIPDSDDVAAAATALRDADRRLKASAGTLAARSKDLADILDEALRFHQKHGDGDCPVCGRPKALDAKWQAHQTAELERLREVATEVTAAQHGADGARKGALALPVPSAQAIARATEVGLNAEAAARALDEWRGGLGTTDLERLAVHLETASVTLRAAASELRTAAETELRRRESVWQPIIGSLTAWLGPARLARAGAAAIPLLKHAEDWVKKAAADMRNERFLPLTGKSQRIWEQLRQQSHVSLDGIQLKGEGNRRHVELDVTVDGKSGSALGVMSQGEINALALSLFIPRATLDESPFRFIVIDDPVQSMDPARVDGLARVLEAAAQTRQVVVFTHDDRLPAAVARLDVEATILEVTRREGSVVEVRTAQDPVGRYIADAIAVAYAENLPAEAAKRVVPGLCRLAIDAACTSLVRRQRIGRGEPHAEVEALLERLKGTTSLAALAIVGDEQRGGDVLPRLDKVKKEYADVFRQVKEGAHALQPAAMVDVIRGAERLARWVQEQR